jgi:hypothetical protein
MNGYDKKTLFLSHQTEETLSVSVQVDITGYGGWKLYRDFNLAPGKPLEHRFPDGFNAYWIRVIASADTTATAQLRYK